MKIINISDSAVFYMRIVFTIKLYATMQVIDVASPHG